MKLHMHPVSSTSRSVMLFAAEANVPLELVVVDLMKGEHHGESYVKLNPNRLVPTLEDGDFVLTESSAIIKYLADKVGSPLYPKDLKQRARVNERMDWINTNLYRDWGYNLIYPQLFAHHKRKTDDHQKGTVEWGAEKSRASLQLLNDSILGSNPYLCGSEMTIADIFAAGILAAGELIGTDFSKFPNVKGWMERIKALPNWKKIHEAHDGYAASLKSQQFVTP